MPVISTEGIYFMGQSFRRVVRVLADGYFHIRLPHAVQNHYDIKEVREKTLDEAMREWKRICGEYQDSVTTSRKVIIYEIQGDNHFAHGCQISLAAQVFNEFKVVSPSCDIRYRYEKVDHEEDLPIQIRYGGLKPRPGDQETECILEWSQERHDFFVGLAVAMEGLKKKLMLLGNDREILEAAIADRYELLTV